MAKASLRRYDVQAKVSFYISLLSILGILALIAMIVRNFDSTLMVVIYNRKGLYSPILMVLTAVTLLIAATGATMGANSAGQKRNEHSRLSWLAFFMGGGILSLTMITFSVFWFYKLPISQ